MFAHPAAAVPFRRFGLVLSAQWWLQAPASATPVRAEWSAGKRTAILAAMAALPVLSGLVRADSASTLPGITIAGLAGIAVVTAISTATAEALVLGLAWELTHPRRVS
jgi:hypothetical protein